MYSTRKPIPEKFRQDHLALIDSCINNLQDGSCEHKESWKILSDVVNFSETFTTHKGGMWRGCDLKPLRLEDDYGLIEEGVEALVSYGNALRENSLVLLDEEGAQSLRDLVECYAEIIEVLPHSEVQKCRNITKQRIAQMLKGNCETHDIVIKVSHAT